MSKKIAVLLSFVYLSGYSSLVLASDTEYKPGELIVRFAPKANGAQRTKAERNEVLTSIDGGNIKHFYKLVPGLTVVKLPANRTVENALPAFKTPSGILYAEPNYKIKLLSTFPNDPNFGELWGMHNTGQPHPRDYGGSSSGTPDADIDAPEAWDISTSSDIIVAVIDTGVNYNHPDLNANMWINPGEIPDNGLDDDNNGYIDDIYGYDFYNNDGDPIDDRFHGTHCAGTIGAVGNNNEGVVGVCWNVRIMPVKFLDSSGGGWTADAIDSIEYAVLMGAHVLSNSWGGVGYHQGLKDEIEAAGAAGVLFVAAAGNSGYDNDSYPAYPASYDCNNIIAVMSTDHNDVRSVHWDRPYLWDWASNYGVTSVDLGAPGTDIFSTFPTYETYAMAYYGFSTDYETISGTSMATPHVAGACALIWSANPKLSHLQVKNIILNSVDKLDSLDGLCLTGGRLNLYKAVLEAAKNEQILSKVDNVNDGDSVLPGDYITYTISYANAVTDPNDPNYIGPLTDVQIIDYLPIEVDPNNPFDPNYDPASHTYTWDIGTLSPGDSNSVTLTVIVNELAEPLGTISNICFLDANEIGTVVAVEVTDVNSWNPGVIYVDVNAAGANTGMSWVHAYTDMQNALERARAGCGSQIWVAEGAYKPAKVVDWSATFELVDAVAMYGGFPHAGGPRNWLTNQTILSGDIDNDGNSDVRDVVTALNVGETTIIDGFTITKGDWSGIWCDVNSSPTIANNTIKENNYDGIDCNENSGSTIIDCTIEDNGKYGIWCLPNSSPTITRSRIQNNGDDGIYCQAGSDVNLSACIIADNDGDGIYCNHSTAAITNCMIQDNGDHGIYDYNSTDVSVIANNIIRGNANNGIFYASFNWGPEIKNNWIYSNGGSGIETCNPSAPPDTNAVIANNTIINNDEYGIKSDYAADVNITNCIIWDNGTNELYAGDSDTFNVSYSCIEGGYTGTGNISSGPCFVDADVNDFHLAADSLCIDAGDPGFEAEPNETDIDGELRVMDGDANDTVIVDMGADEFYHSAADYDWDGIVNFVDYALLTSYWQDAGIDYNDVFLDGDSNSVGLAEFCDEWLREAGWLAGPLPLMGGRGGAGMLEESRLDAGLSAAASAKAEPAVAEPVDIEAIMKWLTEIWLDPDVRKSIDEENFLKVYESLKELESRRGLFR